MFKKFYMGAFALLFFLLPLGGVASAATTANLIANPSLETALDVSTPTDWKSVSWGTNSSTFNYLNTGHTGSRSLEVQTTSYTDGAANWYFTSVPVTAGKTYEYTNWYISDVDAQVDAEITMSDATVQHIWLGGTSASSNWSKFTATFVAPAGAQSISIYQTLAKVGHIITDDYSIGEYTPASYSRGLVSVTFDDGWTNQYLNAYPVMKQLGLNATYYIITGSLADQPDYMNSTQILDLYTNGNEIGSHSVSHPDLTTLSGTSLTAEFANSQATLKGILGGAPVTNFAYPLGAYNNNTIAEGSIYYRSLRSVNRGLNSPDNFNITQLKIQEVDSTNTVAEVEGWINEAIATKTWLILLYHEIAAIPTTPDDALYTVLPQDFTTEMNYLKSSGVTVKTVNQALDEIQNQPVITPPVVKPGDVNGDNIVDALDLSTLLVNWDKTAAIAAQGDINGDGIIDALDLSTLLVNWSK